MSGWLLIVILLLLGGILSTLGDRLGTLVGKARLTVFNLRPRKTAVLITVLTGSLISALSLSLMLLVSRQLRVGLFELDDLQSKLKESRAALIPLKKERKSLDLRIKRGEIELKQLEADLIALRRGDVVIASGQVLASAKLFLDKSEKAKIAIDKLLQSANLFAYQRVLPNSNPNRQILLVPKADVQSLENTLSKRGKWVVNIRSAANVLLGEKYVYAFPEIRPNITVARQGEVLSETLFQPDENSVEIIRKRIKLLLASTFAEVKRRGSLSSKLIFDANSINKLGDKLLKRNNSFVKVEAVSRSNTDALDGVDIFLRINSKSINSQLQD